MNDLALADELRGELRRSAALAGRAAQDERVAAVLDDRVRDRPAIGARHLADRLEPENAASAELAQPRQGVLEAVDLAERDGLKDARSEEHTSELQSQSNLVCRLLLEKKKTV